MFVIYYSTRELLNRFMNAKDAQEQGSDMHRTDYFSRRKYFDRDMTGSLSKKTSNKYVPRPFIYVRGDESYHFKERDSSLANRKRDYPA
ncbi:unnamed protein product [Rotaria magnacalcarata]|nr:unnamed protein product [Rotaria magnacalcarata]